MKNQARQNKRQNGEIVIFIVGIMTIIFTIFLITPSIKNDVTAFSDIREYVGKDAVIDPLDEKLQAQVSSRDVLEYNVISSKGNILEIFSTYNTFSIINNEKLYENSNTYVVDQTTRKHVNDKEYYFIFPTNVKKQNYQLIDPNMEVPATFVFEGVKYVDDLEVYEFSCQSNGDDFSNAWPEYSPEKIYGDQTCKTLIEPITGKTVYFSLTWKMYLIQDGKHITIEQGEAETADFAAKIMMHHAKDTKRLFFIYDYITPTIIIVIFALVFLVYRDNRILKERKELIAKQLEEVKQINKIRIELLEKQVTQNKFGVIGELAASLSHDLRNPLSVIKTSVELLAEKYKEKFDVADKDKIQRINKAVERIADQVDDVLGFVRKNPLALEVISLKTILASSIESLKIPNRIKIKMPESDVKIPVDKVQMETVFSNMINNSIQAISESGEIEIKISENFDNVEIQIIDSGIGIPDDKLSKIFEPLFTTKQSGTGLGLSSCMSIIKNHGGTINVKNNPTTFTITLLKKPEIPEKV